MEYEPVIGLEVHAQLLTGSKMFCTCSSDYAGAPPNSHVCPICLGMPGVLPSINQRAVEYTVMTALALNCEIPEFSKFDRKNYPYPDLVKGYQISQYDMPLSRNGWLEIEVDGETRKVGIIRVHLEEDTAKLLHVTDENGQSYSLVDVNRSGVPLMEIVSAPDIRSPQEARLYLIKLRAILQALGVSTGNMEEGSFRCDANVSVRRPGEPLGTRCEIKNLNSFRFLEKAITFEAQRQIELIEDGGRVRQETRLFDPDRGETRTMRTKEDSHDYRYFPDPDLPPLTIAPAWIEEVRATLPELPAQMAARFVRDYALPEIDAAYLTQSRAHAAYFEACAQACGAPKLAANWIMGELAAQLNRAELELDASPVSARQLGLLITRVQDGTLSGKTAREVFAALWSADEETRGDVDAIIETRGLRQISDGSAIAEAVAAVLAANPKNVEEYRAGKAKALNALVGQVMKATGGRANPQQVSDALRAALAAA